MNRKKTNSAVEQDVQQQSSVFERIQVQGEVLKVVDEYTYLG